MKKKQKKLIWLIPSDPPPHNKLPYTALFFRNMTLNCANAIDVLSTNKNINVYNKMITNTLLL